MSKHRRVDFYVEVALFFVLGILVGVALKVEAGKFLTIGFDDYKMKYSSNQYNINELQKKLNATLAAQEKTSSQNQNSNEQNNPQGASQEAASQ